MYQIWVFDSTGDRVAYLHKAYEIKREQKVNEVPTLSFTMPGDDDKIIYLSSANHIKVYNTKNDEWEGLYDIIEIANEWDESRSVVRVECAGALARLVAEDNISYDTTTSPTTPLNVITALLDLQRGATPIAVGTIEPTTAFAFAIENSNILKAVLECVSYLGGYIEVDETGKLNWRNEPSGKPVREIRYQKNLKGLTRKIDFSQIANRIYAYGFGETEAQLTLVDAGEANEYIEDTISQTEYGIRAKRITDKRIRHPETLLRWARNNLDAYKNPIYSYIVDATNLAAHPDYSFEFESLSIGDLVRVTNPDIGVNVDTIIVSVSEDLSEPHILNIELETITPDLSDTFANIRDSTHLLQNQDVQIGAGQVTVQGVFTVDGWRTAGKTTIDGGQITAGSITVGALSDDTAVMLVYSGSFPPPSPIPDGKLWLDISDPESPQLKRWDENMGTWVVVAEDIEDLRLTVAELNGLMDAIFSDEMVTLDESKSLKLQFEQIKSESTNILSVAETLCIVVERTAYLNALNDLESYLLAWIDHPASEYPISISSEQRDEVYNLFKHVQSTKSELVDKIENTKSVNAVNNLRDDLGDLAYESVVEKAKLGSTIIEGGYLRTGFVDASRIDTGVLNAARVSISSDTTFSPGYDPSQKIMTGGAADDVNTHTTTINGGKITTNTLDAAAIKTSTLTASTTLSVGGTIAVPSTTATNRIIMTNSYFQIYQSNTLISQIANSGLTHGNIIFIDDSSLGSTPTSSAIYCKTKADANALQIFGANSNTNYPTVHIEGAGDGNVLRVYGTYGFAIDPVASIEGKGNGNIVHIKGTNTSTIYPALFVEYAGDGNAGYFKQSANASYSALCVETPTRAANGIYVDMKSSTATNYPAFYANLGHPNTYAFYTNSNYIGSSSSSFAINFGGKFLYRAGDNLYWDGVKIN